MGKIDLFVIGASAGGLDALQQIVKRLPREFPAAICIVVHVAPDSPGLIPEILTNAGPIPARHAQDGARIAPGCIYVAPPDRHLLIDRERRLRLGGGPKENRFRPAIDPLFRSAALAYGGAAAGIILSGGLDDGAAGLAAIKRCGGAAIVQEPDDAETPSMPTAALRTLRPDRRAPASQIAALMVEFAHQYAPAEKEHISMTDLEQQVRAAGGAGLHLHELAELGDPTLFTCPDCHGALVRLRGVVPPSYRCHTGHAFTLRSLAEAVEESVEEALLSASRSLEEYAGLNDHMAKHLKEDAESGPARQVRALADDARRRYHLVRQALKTEK